MYTLRKIDTQNRYGETNIFLGNHYTVTNKHQHEIEFSRILSESGYMDGDVIYAFVWSESQGNLPLSKGYKNYIVMPNGQTFERI